MPKLDPDITKRIIATERDNIAPEVLARLRQKIDFAASDDEKLTLNPRITKRLVVLVADPGGKLGDMEFDAWILQIIDGEKPISVRERIQFAAENYNATRKGKVLPALSVGDALEGVPQKFFKEQQLWIITEKPIPVVSTDTKIAGVPDASAP
jgi:hypothetical protein